MSVGGESVKNCVCLGGWGVEEETNKHGENGIPKLHPQGFIVSKDQWKPS